jgi:hypothetical protein
VTLVREDPSGFRGRRRVVAGGESWPAAGNPKGLDAALAATRDLRAAEVAGGGGGGVMGTREGSADQKLPL